MASAANLAIAGNQVGTRDLATALIREGYQFDLIINCGPEKAHLISGYLDLAPFAKEHGIPLYRPRLYTLKSKADQEGLLPAGLDALLLNGWQRLLPDWLLASLRLGAYGMHGSSEPLPKGRGRSPMNWSLVEGKDHFIAHLLKLDLGVDSGHVVDTLTFDINPWDTIESLYYKLETAQFRLLKQHLPEILSGTVVAVPQPKDVEPTYYPQRRPEDGLIRWEWTAQNVFNLVRAVGRPYPGAFTYLRGQKVMIWSARPFDTRITYPEGAPGQVVEQFSTGKFVVATGNGTLLVDVWECREDVPISVGDRFDSVQPPEAVPVAVQSES
ncbi:MAG: hypothetical protein HY680_01625 [Chloroflexi bacterium]|nr:hypothetical protein [Chloroflexota bacterium]